MYRLFLFGGIALEGPSGPASGRAVQRRQLALLAALAVCRSGHASREKLVGLLWPDRPEAKARHLLRDALYVLRQELGEEVVAEAGGELRLTPSEVWCDVAAFEAALGRAEQAEDAASREAALEEAMELYEGPLLEGFYPDAGGAFERWVEEKRRRLADRHGKALEALAEGAEARGAWAAAVEWWKRRAAQDRTNSRVSIRLMEALAAAGNVAGALRHARVHEQLLEEELGLDPPEELQALADRLAAEPETASPASASDDRPPAEDDEAGAGDAVAPEAQEESAAADPSPGGTPATAAAPVGTDTDADGRPPGSGGLRARFLESRRWTAGLVAFLLAGSVALGWYLLGGAGESPEITEGTVAVLPFEVSGAGAEEWRDGMVSLLSTGLDGAGELRAIADRTVFASWNEAGLSPGGASTGDALAVAREVGAEHAVVGSAAGLGNELQLTADLHVTQTGERLDRVEVRGSPDTVSGLVQELTRQLIAVLAAETGGEMGSAELASVLTESVDALKLYLSGLEHERAMEIGGAIDAYERAFQADSTFTLPYARIGFLRAITPGRTAHGDAIRRAHELADRLPERERRLVQALHLGRIEHRTLAAADSLRELTEEYPDDPSVWQTLGEFVLHEYIPGGWAEGAEAFRRAVQLDPQNRGLYGHYVTPAFALHRDSSLAARRIERMPDGQWKRLYRLGLQAVFGTAETRQRALAHYDTVSVPEPWMAYSPLGAPENAGLRDDVLRRLMERDDLDPTDFVPLLLRNDLDRRRPDRFLRDVERWEPEDDLTARLFVHAVTMEVPVPDSIARRYLAPEHLPAEPSLERLRYAALYGLERGEMDAVKGVLERLRSEGEDDEGSSSAEREAVIQELEGFRAWKEGDRRRAVELLSRSNESGHVGALWRGDLYRELEERETAESWYRVYQMPVVAHERLGGLYEAMGRPEDAAAAYRRVVAAWEDAEERLRPRVEAARKRVRQLADTEEETDG